MKAMLWSGVAAAVWAVPAPAAKGLEVGYNEASRSGGTVTVRSWVSGLEAKATLTSIQVQATTDYGRSWSVLGTSWGPHYNTNRILIPDLWDAKATLKTNLAVYVRVVVTYRTQFGYVRQYVSQPLFVSGNY